MCHKGRAWMWRQIDRTRLERRGARGCNNRTMRQDSCWNPVGVSRGLFCVLLAMSAHRLLLARIARHSRHVRQRRLCGGDFRNRRRHLPVLRDQPRPSGMFILTHILTKRGTRQGILSTKLSSSLAKREALCSTPDICVWRKEDDQSGGACLRPLKRSVQHMYGSMCGHIEGLAKQTPRTPTRV